MTDATARLNAALEGRYRVERELGEGGMATVYLANDLKHERKVALKVLKPELAAVVGGERFLAEIKTTANLQHPHILPLFDSGEAEGFLFYVMPYVEGETLRDRIDREKQLPVDEAVALASKVAGALHHAHEHGVIHRDIKPGNILLQDGEPVVADFGIALAVGAAGSNRLTETGLSLGTPYYMSPEQATGDQAVGASTDTYALGSVLYEMLTGDPPYMGSTAQAVLGQIISAKPISATEKRPSIPANVDAAVRKALEKLPADRFTSAQEFVRALADPGFRHGVEVVADVAAGRGLWNALSIGTTMAAVVATIVAGWALLGGGPEQLVTRTAITLTGSDAVIAIGGGSYVTLDISPDGSAVVFVGRSPDRGRRLWLRPLNRLSPEEIPGTEDAFNPRFSPDGQSIAFTVGNSIRTVSLAGAPPVTILAEGVLEAPLDWGADGMIYFTDSGEAISRVSEAGGGEAEAVTTLGEDDLRHRLPDLLPNGNGLLFMRRLATATGVGDGDIFLAHLSTGVAEELLPGTMARYSHSGHLIYATRDGTLLAAPFDPDEPERVEPGRPLLEGVSTGLNVSRFAVSESGALVYLAGVATGAEIELSWVTRSGAATPVDQSWRFDPPLANYGWRLSPGGTRVAVTREIDGNTDIWIKQLPDGPFERLTNDDGNELYPEWAPDGRFVIYNAGPQILKRPADGTGVPEVLIEADRIFFDAEWSADGAWIVARTAAFPNQIGRRDIVGFHPGVDEEWRPLIASEDFGEHDPSLSPSGLWLAYTSNDTGEREVYVRPFPGTESGRVTVSTNGGVGPVWATGGGELFYVDADRTLIAARVEADSGEFRVIDREPLFTLDAFLVDELGADFYDVASDGRFLMARQSAGPAGDPRLILVQNFFEELERLVPN